MQIPVIETQNPYLGWDPILGTRAIVMVREPKRFRFSIDFGRGAETVYAQFRVYKKKRGRRKFKLRHMFTRSIGYGGK